MTAHRFIEDSSIFEDVDNRTVEVIPINAAHEAVRMAKNEVYQEVLTLLKERTDIELNNGGDSYFILYNLVDIIEKKIK